MSILAQQLMPNNFFISQNFIFSDFREMIKIQNHQSNYFRILKFSKNIIIKFSKLNFTFLTVIVKMLFLGYILLECLDLK